MTDRIKALLDLTAGAVFAVSTLTAAWLLVKGCDAKNKLELMNAVTHSTPVNTATTPNLVIGGEAGRFTSPYLTNCIAIGLWAQADHDASVVIGNYLTSTAPFQISVRYVDGSVERWPLKTNLNIRGLWGNIAEGKP